MLDTTCRHVDTSHDHTDKTDLACQSLDATHLLPGGCCWMLMCCCHQDDAMHTQLHTSHDQPEDGRMPSMAWGAWCPPEDHQVNHPNQLLPTWRPLKQKIHTTQDDLLMVLVFKSRRRWNALLAVGSMHDPAADRMNGRMLLAWGGIPAPKQGMPNHEDPHHTRLDAMHWQQIEWEDTFPKLKTESSGSWLMKKCYVSVLKELCVWWAWLVFKLLKKNSETTCCSWLWRMYGSLLELKNYYPDLCIVNERWKESRPTVSKSDLDMRFSENLLSVWNQPNRMNDSYMWTIINNPVK